MKLEEPFEDVFSSLLSELTMNSRPIITDLTKLAEDNISKAPYIVDSVEARIKKALPDHKLYVFYLLDSISKNVGNPYNLLFSNKLATTFIENYSLVNDTIRQKLINLFKTWISAKTNTGSQLFAPEVIQKIEAFIIRATSRQKPAVSALNPKSPLVLTPEMILSEAESLLDYTRYLDKMKDENTQQRQAIRQFLLDLKKDILQYGISSQTKSHELQSRLQKIRKDLDLQTHTQRQNNPDYVPFQGPNSKNAQGVNATRNSELDPPPPKKRRSRRSLSFKLPIANMIYLSDISQPIEKHLLLMEQLNAIGYKRVGSVPAMEARRPKKRALEPVPVKSEGKETVKDVSNILGLDQFQNRMLSSLMRSKPETKPPTNVVFASMGNIIGLPKISFSEIGGREGKHITGSLDSEKTKTEESQPGYSTPVRDEESWLDSGDDMSSRRSSIYQILDTPPPMVQSTFQTPATDYEDDVPVSDSLMLGDEEFDAIIGKPIVNTFRAMNGIVPSAMRVKGSQKSPKMVRFNMEPEFLSYCYGDDSNSDSDASEEEPHEIDDMTTKRVKYNDHTEIG